MAEKQKIDSDYNYQKIAKERLLWVVKPLVIVSLTVFCLHPNTSRLENVDTSTLMGFLFGALFALFVRRDVIYHYMVVRRSEYRKRKNRMPDEYYFGKVKEVLQLDGE